MKDSLGFELIEWSEFAKTRNQRGFCDSVTSGDDSKYITDGHMLLIKEYVKSPTKKMVARRKLHGPIPDSSIERILLDWNSPMCGASISPMVRIIDSAWGHDEPEVMLEASNGVWKSVMDANKILMIVRKVPGAAFMIQESPLSPCFIGVNGECAGAIMPRSSKPW